MQDVGKGGLILSLCCYVHKQLLQKDIEKQERKKNSFQVLSSVSHAKIKA